MTLSLRELGEFSLSKNAWFRGTDDPFVSDIGAVLDLLIYLVARRADPIAPDPPELDGLIDNLPLEWALLPCSAYAVFFDVVEGEHHGIHQLGIFL
ncbi:hypothetical protein QA639_04745 [Bradyrhizobium pachyrhizi]|uniref:hypothetical protein n=1 Tax=Bradyrhizobium pachyrhizi TaxID=280333 RepID=UPI0024B14CE0|nr:hypothetical protein [Bradyrhizobium pachyrhizi]WFU56839.1 hypothetical protein QA639_04745 [Bradyrhizobium pachyrhizi]